MYVYMYFLSLLPSILYHNDLRSCYSEELFFPLMEAVGIEPRNLGTASKQSTIELHPPPPIPYKEIYKYFLKSTDSDSSDLHNFLKKNTSYSTFFTIIFPHNPIFNECFFSVKHEVKSMKEILLLLLPR